MVKCVCQISGPGASGSVGIVGTLTLSQAHEDAPVSITGRITGLAPGSVHGLFVGTYGDLETSPAAASPFDGCGPIFDPFGADHGLPTDPIHKAGDLGNVAVDATTGAVAVRFVDPAGLVKLIGPTSVIGRSIYLTEKEDDGGRGGQEGMSCGGKIAAGVVGIAKE
eukprot:CAMPEP_0113307878 /NCGR_PEP_ID=MMETSP0010_2-20120614/6546_1 /TAXON_ID=216773 ORGANISM="Corethron hystrix, Strain 308" /NCGR_SAMPLE_ID=MMETSP0010_2 /ASSEMBLY_ACC=CAM_ASM_000155 /LENGTH=165 /DNA_ID=CAMNT_0000162819 /DNA_START=149 /DNA_END=646 /DNA_ORIENTATION=- /assembly_acc=CAM_ASM_000155